MRTNPPNRPFRAALVMVAIVLGAGSLSLARMFHITNLIDFGLTTDHFQFAVSEPAPSTQAQTATAQDSFSRVAPAWLTNAMPGYSSGRAREMWYLSLNSAGDRELRLYESGGTYVTTANPYDAARAGFAGFQFGRGPVSPMAMSAPSTGATNGSGSIPVTPQSAITSPSSVNGPAVWSATPVTGNWNNDLNWNPAAPNGSSALAVFGATNISTVFLTSFSPTAVADIIFGSTAGGYSILVPDSHKLIISGAGVTNNSSAIQNFVAQGNPGGTNHATGEIDFLGSATAGNNRVTYTAEGGGDAGTIAFFNSATAGTANFITTASPSGVNRGGQIQFWNTTSADHAILTANGSTAGNPTGTGGHIEFFENSDAGAATLIANNGLGPVTEGSGTGGMIRFNGDSTGGTARVEVFGNGNLSISSISGLAVTIGSLEGDGYVFLGGRTLGIGSNNQSTTFSGTIAGTLTGDTAGGVTKVGTGVLVLSGTNTYTGDTTVAGGELFLAQTGSLASSSTIRLGDTVMDSPSAIFSFGPGDGVQLLNSLIVQASASGTEGTRTLLSLASSGNINHWAGDILLNTDLVVQAAAAGGSVANGQGTLRLAGTTNVLDNTLEMNSNLRGNNADTYSIQGTVLVTGELTSTLATGGSVVKDGSGTMILFNPNNRYTGTNPAALNPAGTQIRGGILEIWGDGALGLAPSTSTNNVFFQNSAYNTNSDSIAPTLRAGTGGITLAATRDINIANGVTARFDSNGNTFTINGTINGAGNLAKIGAGTLILNAANTYTGTTTINAGTLNANVTNALGSTASGTSNITVNSGGTLLLSNSGTIDRINNNAGITLNGNGSPTASINTSGLSEYTAGSVSPGMGALTLQSSSIIDLGSGSSIIAFASSALQAANWNGTLSIYNWSGTLLTGNGTDQVYFGTGVNGLTPTQLLQIDFYSDGGSTFLGFGSWGIDGDGEVVPLAPIPEPSTWVGAALALAAIGWTQRKRFSKP